MTTQRLIPQLVLRPSRRIVLAPKDRGKTRGHSRRAERPAGPLFGAGETVRETGIYEVLHDRNHRQAHEAVMLHDDAFPFCDSCKDRVRFRLVRTAPYIFHDEDFEEQE
jgi:hypothetical protein